MYKFDILEVKNYEIIKVDKKIFYNSDTEVSLSEWLKKNTPNNKNKEILPNLSSPLKIKQSGKRKISPESLGWFSCGTTTIQRNVIDVGIFSSPYGHSGTSGFEVHDDNFYKIISSFTSRSLIDIKWYNEKDIYLAPNEKHEKYCNFEKDSLVISIFSNMSNQSSLRRVNYNGQLWDIKNQFFWMSKEEMMSLANQNNYTEVYNDARTDSDRYVYNSLFGEKRIYDRLSTEAKDVLDTATELVRLSIEMRINFADDHNHLNSWDAGYAQLKLLWKEYFPEQFKEFRNKYKVLEDKMRPMVYELGFLKK